MDASQWWLQSGTEQGTPATAATGTSPKWRTPASGGRPASDGRRQDGFGQRQGSAHRCRWALRQRRRVGRGSEVGSGGGGVSKFLFSDKAMQRACGQKLGLWYETVPSSVHRFRYLEIYMSYIPW
jgi:hypothetical protein